MTPYGGMDCGTKCGKWVSKVGCGGWLGLYMQIIEAVSFLEEIEEVVMNFRWLCVCIIRFPETNFFGLHEVSSCSGSIQSFYSQKHFRKSCVLFG